MDRVECDLTSPPVDVPVTNLGKELVKRGLDSVPYRLWLNRDRFIHTVSTESLTWHPFLLENRAARDAWDHAVVLPVIVFVPSQVRFVHLFLLVGHVSIQSQ